MIKKGLLIPIFSMLAACTHVPEDSGFSDVRTLVGNRSGIETGWRRDGSSAARIDETVKALEVGEIDAGRAVRIALLNNPALQATYERLGIAAADLAQAGLLSNPRLDTVLRFPENGGKAEIELGLVQNFIDLLTLPARQRMAQHEFETVKLEVAGAALALAAETRAAYFDLVAARQKAKSAAEYARAANAAYDLNKALRKAGNITELALANWEVALRRAELARDEADLEARQAALKLGLAMGIEEAQVKALDFAAILPPAPPRIFDLASLDRMASVNRLDLEAARARVDVMAARLKIKVDWRLVSDLELGVQSQRDSEGRWSTGPSLSIALPVFDQGQAHVSKGQAQLRQTSREYEVLALKIHNDLREVLGRLTLARARVTAYEETLLPLQARILDLTQKNYNYMIAGAFDLLAARQEQVNAEGRYIDALHDYWRAHTALEAAVGGDLVLSKTAEK